MHTGSVRNFEIDENRATSLVSDENAQQTSLEILKELRLISLKLDCLQPDGEQLDINDLEQTEGD